MMLLVVVATWLVATIVSSPALAGEDIPMVDDQGQVTLVEVETSPPRLLTESEREAFDHPGTEVPINISPSTFQRVDFWHIRLVYKYDEAIVFQDGRFQTISRTGTIVSEQSKLAVYVVLALIAIGLMSLSNILMMINRHQNSDFTAAADFLAAVVVATFAFAAFAVVSAFTVFTVFTAFTAAFAIVAAVTTKEDIKLYCLYSLGLYIFMVIVILV